MSRKKRKKKRKEEGRKGKKHEHRSKKGLSGSSSPHASDFPPFPTISFPRILSPSPSSACAVAEPSRAEPLSASRRRLLLPERFSGSRGLSLRRLFAARRWSSFPGRRSSVWSEYASGGGSGGQIEAASREPVFSFLCRRFRTKFE